ncbi:hypothetical protein [Dethiothermospora halolimnae]|uniref:hypothetical protein n=1 Tax=Dethiothermospora halolimnae TaxID=3114390 RepID=UPI003CCC2FA5
MLDTIDKIKEMLEPIYEVFYAIMHPIQTLNKLLDISLAYIPILIVVIFFFYIVTQSPKIFRVFTAMVFFFVMIKIAIVFNMSWLLLVVVVAVLVIRLLGVVM